MTHVLKMQPGQVSNQAKVKFRMLQDAFHDLLGHIRETDILFFAVDGQGPEPMVLMVNDQSPWQQLVPYQYILVEYDQFRSMMRKSQMAYLAHQLLKIPKDYLEGNVQLRKPTQTFPIEEKQIAEFLEEYRFEST